MPLFGPTSLNSASVPICAQQLTFHNEVWDFRAREVYRTDAMCPRSVHLRVAFLAKSSQAVGRVGPPTVGHSGKDQWSFRIRCNNSMGTGFPRPLRIKCNNSLVAGCPRPSPLLRRSGGKPAATFHPLLPSRIFSTSLVRVKVRAANTIRARAIKPVGIAHLGAILSEEATWPRGGD